MYIARATWNEFVRMTIVRNDTKQCELRSVSSRLNHTRKCLRVSRANCGVLFTWIVSSRCQLPASGLFSSPWRVELTSITFACTITGELNTLKSKSRQEPLVAGSHIPDSLISSVPRRTLLLLLCLPRRSHHFDVMDHEEDCHHAYGGYPEGRRACCWLSVVQLQACLWVDALQTFVVPSKLLVWSMKSVVSSARWFLM